MQYKFVNVTKPVRIDGSLRESSDELVVWWYGGFVKNKRQGFTKKSKLRCTKEIDRTQPLVRVGFRKLYKNGGLSAKIFWHEISLTYLRFVRIGTVWKEGLCEKSIIWQEREYVVKAQKGCWVFQSFRIPDKLGNTEPYPPTIHTPATSKDPSFFIKFILGKSASLLVPCMEYFVSCYGLSSEATRIVSTYDEREWPVRLYNDDGCFNDGTTWRVQLRKRLKDDDATFVAHLRFDEYTKKVVRSIRSSIVASYMNTPHRPLCIRIGPWFHGEFRIKVRGIPFNAGQCFLAQQVVGASWANGPRIEHTRDNRGDPRKKAPSDAAPSSWVNSPSHSDLKSSPIAVDLNSFESPDNGSEVLEIEDDVFQILKSDREVKKISFEQAKTRSDYLGSISIPADSFSSGDTYGGNGDIGLASVKAKVEMESQGLIRDLWNAIRASAYGTELIAEWYTKSDGFCALSEPKLMPFALFRTKLWSSGKTIEKSTLNWPYLDPNTKMRQRGMLVARLRYRAECVYFLEIQRRPNKSARDRGEEKSSESYRIFVFKTNNEKKPDIEKKIHMASNVLRNTKGTLEALKAKLSADCTIINHSHSRFDTVHLLATVRNGLRKLGMEEFLAEIKKNRK